MDAELQIALASLQVSMSPSEYTEAIAQARAEARAAALEEAAKVAETFFTNPHATDLSARALKAVTARIRALIEESP